MLKWQRSAQLVSRTGSWLITSSGFIRIDETHGRCSAGLVCLCSPSALCCPPHLLLPLGNSGLITLHLPVGPRGLISALHLGSLDPGPISGAAGTAPHGAAAQNPTRRAGSEH